MAAEKVDVVIYIEGTSRSEADDLISSISPAYAGSGLVFAIKPSIVQ